MRKRTKVGSNEASVIHRRNDAKVKVILNGKRKRKTDYRPSLIKRKIRTTAVSRSRNETGKAQIVEPIVIALSGDPNNVKDRAKRASARPFAQFFKKKKMINLIAGKLTQADQMKQNQTFDVRLIGSILISLKTNKKNKQVYKNRYLKNNKTSQPYDAFD